MGAIRTRLITSRSNGTRRRSLLDVRVRRGADVGSDHHLLTARIRMKLRRTDRQQPGHRRFDVNKLDDPAVKKSFLTQLKIGTKHWLNWTTIQITMLMKTIRYGTLSKNHTKRQAKK